jgi:uncharacterized protein
MSERDGYEPGVPCWVATVHSDPEKAVSFYTQLFGWEATNLMPPESPGKYFVCRRRGRDVAAIGSERGGAPSVPAWDTYIWAESADETVAKVTDAGGSVVIEPFDRLDAARMALVADPAGAVFYGVVFGWETDTFDMGEGEITLWRLPGYVGGEPSQPVSREVVGVMVPMSGDRSPEDVSAHWSIDFWVDDVDAAADKAAEQGGEIKVSPFHTSIGRTAILSDPQGAVFSVSKVGPPGA